MAPTRTYSNHNTHLAHSSGQHERMCNFCKRNREAPAVYRSHNTKDASGRVTCPQLRRYICPGCGATGDDAHTRSYCPSLQPRTGPLAPRATAPATPSLGAPPPPNRLQPRAKQQAAGGRHSSPAGQVASGSGSGESDIELGRSQALNNMSRVTNSRYNSAGRLRFPQQQHQRRRHDRSTPSPPTRHSRNQHYYY